ncbi:MAG: histidine kinase [Flavobacteriaceae bacterium]
MKINQNTLYWILQCLGWGSLAGLNTFGKFVSKSDLNKNYIYAEGLLFFLSAILATTIVRFYLKKRLTFEKFESKEFGTLAIGLILGSAVLFTSMLFAKPIYNYFHNKNISFTTTEIISTLVNVVLFVFFWIIIYYTIKLLRKFAQNRLLHLELESSLKESQLNTLKGQINPHFMFNSLNNIRGLMLEDVDKSREMITRLSEMLRYSLTKNKIDKIALLDELEMVENYIALSKIQLEDRLIFKKNIEESLINTEIPPMIIQMLIENAVKHGISNLPKGGIVALSIQKETDNLVILVSNTGQLALSKHSTKVGLENIKKRLSLLYGKNAKFSLIENNNEVLAKIELPILK